jgi:type VI secretion system secreted protein Hcp
MSLVGYHAVEGEKQGKIDGDCTRKGFEKTSLVFSYQSEITIPTDQHTGLATGNRWYKPFRITKEVDSASPQLFQACCTGEHLKSVLLTLVNINKTGTEQVYYTVTLTDATIVNIKQMKLETFRDQTAKVPDLEEIEYRFRQITVEHKIAAKSASDDWNVPST